MPTDIPQENIDFITSRFETVVLKKGTLKMKLSELYMANDNWAAMSTLSLVDEDLTIIEGGIDAYLADFFYGQHEVASFKGNLVILKNLKEDKTNE